MAAMPNINRLFRHTSTVEDALSNSNSVASSAAASSVGALETLME
jgi:hypothetical protein